MTAPDVAADFAIPPGTGVETMDYDFSSRHIIAVRLVGAMLPAGSRLLDLGGSAGMTAQLLPDYRVIVVDVLPEGVDVVASGAALPFADDSYHALLALDVLEHVPEAVRPKVVEEAARVADVVIFAGPYDDPQVRQAELERRAHFESLYGHPHPWLAEHLENGLPSLDKVSALMQDLGLQIEVFGSNPLELWSLMLEAGHSAQRLGLDDELAPLRRRLVEEFLGASDSAPPSYRHFIVGARDPKALALARRVFPGSSGESAASAAAEIKASLGRIVGKAGQSLIEMRAHVGNLEKGLVDLRVELAKRQEAAGAIADELTHRQSVIDDLSAEAQHRLKVIDDLAVEAEHRLEVINEVVSERDALAIQAHQLHEELTQLRRIIEGSRLARSIVRRRSPG